MLGMTDEVAIEYRADRDLDHATRGQSDSERRYQTNLNRALAKARAVVRATPRRASCSRLCLMERGRLDA
jgi:hypothetical protein